THYGGHSAFKIAIQARLRTILVVQHDDRSNRCAVESQFLRRASKLFHRLDQRCCRRFLLQLHCNGFAVTVEYIDAMTLCAYSKTGMRYFAGRKFAEYLLRLGFNLTLFAVDVWNNVIDDIERSDSGKARA